MKYRVTLQFEYEINAYADEDRLLADLYLFLKEWHIKPNQMNVQAEKDNYTLPEIE